jgi:hypothetical protein
LQRSCGTAIDVSARWQPLEMPPEGVALELNMIDIALERLKARQDGLTEQAKALIRGGKSVPGYALEAGQGRERWAKPVGEVIALGEMMDIALAKPGAITPKQAIKAGLPKEVVASYSETPSGEIKLVASETTQMRKVFSKS